MAQALLTVREAAHQLAVHPDTVRRLIERGDLPCIRVGRNVRIHPGELNGYVHRQRPPAPVQKITPGQLRAFHAKADRVDRLLRYERKTTKHELLAVAAARFGIKARRGEDCISANDLDELQATWCLDQLEARVDQLLTGAPA